MIKTLRAQDIRNGLVNSVLDIESQVLPDDVHYKWKEIYDRYDECTDMFLFLYCGEKLIGYMCLLPVKECLYQKINSVQQIQDLDVNLSEVERCVSTRKYKLFIVSTAIHPNYQNRGFSKYLRYGLYRYFSEFRKYEDVVFTDAVSISTSEEGNRFLEKAGFMRKKTLDSGQALFHLELSELFYHIIDKNWHTFTLV